MIFFTYCKNLFSNFSPILFLIILFSIIPAESVSGQTLLDNTFNGNGIVTTQYNAFNSKSYNAIQQPDGKIIIVGSANTNPGFPGSYQLSVIRYNSDGSLDTSFNGNGKFTFTPDSTKPSVALAAALQSDGKIVVAGNTGLAENLNQDAFVLRINANGSIDTTFDGDGVRIFNFDVQNAHDTATDVLIQPNGKIVIADRTVASGFQGFVIARLNSDGSFDTSFGTNGSVRIFGFITDAEPKLLLQPDGKFIVSAPSVENMLVRINADGTLDSGFGTNGTVNQAGGNGIVRQPDGKILVVNNISQVNVIVRRYNSDGTLDTSFGTNGSSTVTFTNQDGNIKPPYDIALQTDGKIVVGGTVKLTTNPDNDFALARLNSDGSNDTLFGFNGRLTTDIQGWDIAHALLLQSDGKMILTGESAGGFTTTRYISSTLNNNCRPFVDFNGDGKSDLAYFNNAGEWKFLSSINGGGGTIRWGKASDYLVPADFNGDCRTDFAVFRDGIWYIKTLEGVETYYQFGLANDIPVPADYDGDDLADPTVYRNGIWYVLGTRDGFFAAQFGINGDKPVPGDYDGDGKEDFAIYRNGIWWLSMTTDGVTAIQFGLSNDKPVAADYDGDGKTDIAVYRPSSGTWYVLQSQQGFTAIRWGISTDLPVPADYDGDGKTDFAVYRDGDWYLLQTTSGFQLKTFGDASVRPIQNAYVY